MALTLEICEYLFSSVNIFLDDLLIPGRTRQELHIRSLLYVVRALDHEEFSLDYLLGFILKYLTCNASINELFELIDSLIKETVSL